MSTLIGQISKIEKEGSLHLVHFLCEDQSLCMMSLDLESHVKVGTKVSLAIKPSEVAIAKDFVGELSYSNRLKATILKIEEGTLLTVLSLSCVNTRIEAILIRSAYHAMGLKEGDEVWALIKASELSIRRVLA
jgi:molybdopterin-binding protein